MNNPNAANTSAHPHASNPHSTHAAAGNSAPANAPTTNATSTDTAPMIIARTSFTATYATGRNGVNRNCRDQPAARSIDTIAPATGRGQHRPVHRHAHQDVPGHIPATDPLVPRRRVRTEQQE